MQLNEPLELDPRWPPTHNSHQSIFTYAKSKEKHDIHHYELDYIVQDDLERRRRLRDYL